jgi:predicted phosphodiesterase
MIFITGDTHVPVDVNKLNTKKFPEQKRLTKNDSLIICGDFGGVWDGGNEDLYWQKWFDQKRFTTLFVDGNHENFDLLEKYPVTTLHGGKVHRIRDSIYHLIRGEVYEIEGKRIFVMGGASSHDKQYRTEGKNWWRQELPSAEEYHHASETLRKHRFHFDYIITHTCPTRITYLIGTRPDFHEAELNGFLDWIYTEAQFRHW